MTKKNYASLGRLSASLAPQWRQWKSEIRISKEWFVVCLDPFQMHLGMHLTTFNDTNLLL